MKTLIPISVQIWWQPGWAVYDTTNKGVSGTHHLLIETINQPSYSKIEINPVFHKHSICTTKFMVTHNSHENIIICNMYLPVLPCSVLAP